MAERVGVARVREIAGASRLDMEVEGLEIVSLKEAMQRSWKTDAHFVTYDLPNESKYPRINKEVVPQLREAGGEIWTTMAVLDYDTEGHKPWTQDSFEEFLDLLERVESSGFPLVRMFSYFYTTRNGARWIYRLKSPMHLEEAQAHWAGLVGEFIDRGISIDPTSAQWWRMFRLPRVLRDGKRTEDDPFYWMVDQHERKLDLYAIKKRDQVRQLEFAPSIQVEEEKPDELAALALIEPGKESWLTKAKRRMRGRSSYGILFGGEEIARPGARARSIFSYVAQAVAILFYLENTTPAHVYALFLEAVQRLEPDDQTPDWTDTLWAAVVRAWGLEAGRAKQVKLRMDVREMSANERLQRVLEGAQAWCDDPEIHGPEEQALEWVQQRLIVSTPASLFIMRPDGHYDAEPVSSRQLFARVRELGMADVIPLTTMDGKGNVRARHWQDVINDHATVVSQVEGVVGQRGGILAPTQDGSNKLVLGLFDRRNDLEPTYNPQVDEWLEYMGGKKADRLREWLGLALDFRAGPICALSICGPPGIGKKLLMQGLAECVTTECFADASEFGQFQYMLMRSPFLWVNEGVPGNVSGARGIADAFRHFVGGDPITATEKYKTPIILRNPLRIVFTANNLDVVEVLAGKRDLSPEDRQALATRLFHIDSHEDAGTWLRDMGGLAFTSRPGNRWIRSDAGERSDYVVARHFLWLFKHRPSVPAGNRLLMEGDLKAGIVDRLATRAGSAPSVIETLIRMIESEANQVVEGLVTKPGKVYVTSSGVVDFFRRDLGRRGEALLNHKMVTNVFRGLSVRSDAGTPSVLDTRDGPRRAVWHELDVRRLLHEAVDHGYRCDRLEKIVQAVFPGEFAVDD